MPMSREMCSIALHDLLLTSRILQGKTGQDWCCLQHWSGRESLCDSTLQVSVCSTFLLLIRIK